MKRYYIPKSGHCIQLLRENGLNAIIEEMWDIPETIFKTLNDSGRLGDGVCFTYMNEPPARARIELEFGVTANALGRSTARESSIGIRSMCSTFLEAYSDAILVFINCMFPSDHVEYLSRQKVLSVHHKSNVYHIVKQFDPDYYDTVQRWAASSNFSVWVLSRYAGKCQLNCDGEISEDTLKDISNNIECICFDSLDGDLYVVWHDRHLGWLD